MLLLKTILEGREGIHRHMKIKINFIIGWTPLWTVVPQNDASLAMTQKTHRKISIKPKLKIVVNKFAWCSANARSFMEMTMVSFFFFLLRLVVRAKYMPNIVWPHFSTHTVAHSIRPSFRPKINNQPLKKFWVKVVKNSKILTAFLSGISFHFRQFVFHYGFMNFILWIIWL